MKVYALIENRYCRHEFNEDHLMGIFGSYDNALAVKPNDFINWGIRYTYRIKEFTLGEIKPTL